MGHGYKGWPALAVSLAWACWGTARAEDSRAGADSPPVWSAGGEALYFHRRDAPDYLLGTLHADRGPLHLEARYNYEDLQTLSAFVGWNLGAGERLRLELTPLLGGVVGRTDGVAAGLELTLSWWQLVLDSENEYVLALDGWDSSFFYTWSELSLWPVEWARAGVNLQWTRYTGASPVAERGFHAGLAYRSVSVAAYVFNPGADNASLVLLFSAEL